MDTRSYEPKSDWTALRELGDWELQDGDQDIRGLSLVTEDGEPLGSIEELLVDCEEGRVAAVCLDNGRTVPVEPLVIEDTRVLLRDERSDEEVAPVTAAIQPAPRIAAPAAVKDQPIVHQPDTLPLVQPKLQRGPIRVRRKTNLEPTVPATGSSTDSSAAKRLSVAPPTSMGLPIAKKPSVAASRPSSGTSTTQQHPVARSRPSTGSSKKLWDWNKIGVGAAVLGAAAGAALLRRKGNDDDFELRLETDENLRLIASSKVEGTAVYGRGGEALGEIDSFMVDKYTGRVAYAVLKLRGTFGFGSSLFPLPWPVLEYDSDHDGYVLDVTKEQFAGAPKFQPSEEPEFDGDYRRLVMHHYSLGRY